jgi:hypothetical protein
MFDIRLSEFSNCQSSESNRCRSVTTSGRRYSAGAGIQPPDSSRNIARFRPSQPDLAKTVGSGRIQPLIRPDLAKTVGIWPDMTWSGHWSGWIRKFPAGIRPFWSDPVKLSRKNQVTVTGRCGIPTAFVKIWFLNFWIFSYEPNTEKHFRENHFFWK